MTTTPADIRWQPKTTVLEFGEVEVTVLDRDRTQPFLLLHGGGGPLTVAGFADLLAARCNARVLAPTHPGFAGTPRPESFVGIKALACLYADLLDREDIWDVTVIGNSIGGWIASELALLNSPRVSGVVLVDAVGIDVPEHPVTDVSKITPEELRGLSYHDPSHAVPGKPDLEALGAYTEMRMSDPTLRDRLAGVDLPVSVIWGESDGIVVPAYGEAFAKAIPGARFTVLPEAGHLPQLEVPEQLLAAIGAER